jgi:putative ABC transport system permease protein
VDRDTLMALQEVPGVEGIEPYNNISVMYQLHPDAPWRQGVIQLREYTGQKYELVQLREGEWPRSKNEIGVERMAALSNNISIGDTIRFKAGDQERSFEITSLVRHPFVPPPQFMDVSFYFAGSAGLERFGFPEDKYNCFFVRVTPYSSDHAKEIATAIKDKLAKQNIRVVSYMYQDPNRHWGRSYMDSYLIVQQLLAVLCVLMSTILVYNTVTNLITQQTNQIGILKAIGGRKGTIAAWPS